MRVNASGNRCNSTCRFSEFSNYLNTRITIFRGELTDEHFGLSDDDYHKLVDTTEFLDPLRRVAQSQIRKAAA